MVQRVSQLSLRTSQVTTKETHSPVCHTGPGSSSALFTPQASGVTPTLDRQAGLSPEAADLNASQRLQVKIKACCFRSDPDPLLLEKQLILGPDTKLHRHYNTTLILISTLGGKQD